MPAWINVFERVVAHVAISVKVLWIARARHNAVRTEEAANGGRVESRAVVIQRAEAALFVLSGEAAVGRRGAHAGLAKRLVAHCAQTNAIRVHCQTGAAQVVAGEIIHHVCRGRLLAHRHARAAGKVITRRHTGADVLLIQIANVDCRLTVLYFLDTVAVAVVGVRHGLAVAAHAAEPVLGIPGLVVGHTAFDARGHVAVGVVPELLHAIELRHRVFGALIAVAVTDPVLALEVANLIVGVIIRAIVSVAVRAASGLSIDQTIQSIVVEGLGLRVASLVVLNGQHVADHIIGISAGLAARSDWLRAGLVRQYQQLEQVLNEELGTIPLASTRQLYETLKDGP